eukprot:1000366_1
MQTPNSVQQNRTLTRSEHFHPATRAYRSRPAGFCLSFLSTDRSKLTRENSISGSSQKCSCRSVRCLSPFSWRFHESSTTITAQRMSRPEPLLGLRLQFSSTEFFKQIYKIIANRRVHRSLSRLEVEQR